MVSPVLLPLSVKAQLLLQNVGKAIARGFWAKVSVLYAFLSVYSRETFESGQVNHLPTDAMASVNPEVALDDREP